MHGQQNIKKYIKKYFKRTLVQKFSRIKVRNALAVPILLNGSEIRTSKKKGIKMIDLNLDEVF